MHMYVMPNNTQLLLKICFKKGLYFNNTNLLDAVNSCSISSMSPPIINMI